MRKQKGKVIIVICLNLILLKFFCYATEDDEDIEGEEGVGKEEHDT